MTSIENTPRFRQTIQTNVERVTRSPYYPLGEDLDWFHEEWTSIDKPLPGPVLRRGSASLRQLLCEGAIFHAWRHHGLEDRPLVVGPDLIAIAQHHNQNLDHAVSVIAGGAAINGVQYAHIGAWRVDNQTTGVPADAEEGFAVGIGSITKDVRSGSEVNELSALVDREWKIDNYLNAPGAVRRGQTVSRRSIINFFANYAGGVHLDRATGNSNAEKQALYALVEELEERVSIDKVEGLYFELLSVGQALGSSPSMRELSKAIQENRMPQKAKAQPK